MPDQLQLRGGTTAQHTSFTGASKEVTVDTTKKTAVVHDGSTAGGNPLMREDGTNSALTLGSAATPSLKFTGDPNTGIFSPAGGDQIAISTAGVGRLFVSATGGVGIGSAATSTLLHVYPSANTTSAATICLEGATNGYGAGIEFSSRTSSGGTLVAMAKVTADGEDSFNTTASTQDAGLRFFTAANGALGERMRLTSAGALNIVGAGTAGSTNAVSFNGSAPVNSLTVDSNGRLLVGTSSARSAFYSSTIDSNIFQIERAGGAGTSAGASFFTNNNGSGFPFLILGKSRGSSLGANTVVQSDDIIGQILFAGSDGTQPISAATIQANIDGTPGANNMPARLVFSTTPDTQSAPTERMRITQAGNVGIGTIFHNANPTTTLTVAKSIGTPTVAAVSIQRDNGVSNVTFVTFGPLNAETGFGGIRRDGANIGPALFASSDRRVKINFAPLSPTLSKLTELPLYEYDYKKGGHGIGPLAQEVVELFPEKVEATDDGLGNDLPEGVEPWTLNQNWHWEIIKAIQEQQVMIAELQAEVATLKAQ